MDRGPGLDPALSPLRGHGVLAIWNGIEAGDEAEFEEWHTRQHLPERAAVPGFLRARRYVNADVTDPSAGERYFTLYEVAEPGVLASAPYLERLDRPTPWTTEQVALFRNGRRTACRIVESLGTGAGGALATIELPVVSADDGRPDTVLGGTWLRRLLERNPALVGVHLLEPDAAATAAKAATAEGRSDTNAGPAESWTVLLEALSVEALEDPAGEIVVALSPALDGPPTTNRYHLQVLLP